MSFKHKHSFKYEIYDSDDELFPNKVVTVEIDGTANLNAMLEAFREYLDGAGFYVQGELEINEQNSLPHVNIEQLSRQIENKKMFKSMMFLKK